jgi:5-methyltetrahydrofolate--homocysteine methyltransferase
MEKQEDAEGNQKSNSKGKFLIAPVKGDVHDIGKNLVDIILTNNGYEVINLGIKQSVEAIVEAQKQHQADCIAMSGLLVKSTAFMKDNLRTFNEVGINVPVILGGAALTPRFVHGDCRAAYGGQVIYGRDAFADLRFMDALMEAKATGRWDHGQGFLDGTPEGLGPSLGSSEGLEAGAEATESTPAAVAASATPAAPPASDHRSEAVPEEQAISPPFWGARLLDEGQVCSQRQEVSLRALQVLDEQPGVAVLNELVVRALVLLDFFDEFVRSIERAASLRSLEERAKQRNL